MTLPDYGLVAIVKDEAGTIRPFIDSARRYCAAATFVDTGSTDDTVDIIRRTWPEARIDQIAWDGFGPARSHAFGLAHGTARTLLALDADMAVEVDPGWEPDPTVDAYMVEMGNRSAFRWRLPLVLNGAIPFRAVGRAHAYTCRRDGQPMVTRPTDAVRVTYPDRSSPGKTEWQRDMLLRDLSERPDDPRATFYLAQTERELGNLVTARHLYLKRARMGGYAAEAWYAAYRGALLAEWPSRLAELVAAWEQRPDRLEPLAAALRDLNARRMHRTAWALAETAWQSRPPDDLFVDRSAWPAVLAEMSIAAWHTGRRDRSVGFALMALASPDITAAWRGALERNLALAEDATPLRAA